MKVIYVRQGEQIPDFKQRFEIRYPIVDGVKNAVVKRRIESAIDYWKVFDTSLDDDLHEYTWLDSMDYEVAYNDNGILDIELTREGSAAYPDGFDQHIVVSTTTGRTVTIANAFTNIAGLKIKIDEAEQTAIAKQVEELKADEPSDALEFQRMMDEKEYQKNDLGEFSISDTGVTFIYDYGFPHVIQALSPSGEFFFSWKEITPFVKARGPLGNFRVE